LFGGSKGGGSTLTQQLVKNAILSNERSLVRKIKELILSIELERRYSKDEILQIYFNEIGYGSSYYGAESAAQNYFHTNVSQLSLAQIATLAEATLGSKDHVRHWLRHANHALGGVTPLACLDTEPGRRQVEAILYHIRYGMIG
jgi:membrane carboxypeptidase/penicillin-binding protein